MVVEGWNVIYEQYASLTPKGVQIGVSPVINFVHHSQGRDAKRTVNDSSENVSPEHKFTLFVT